MKEKAALLKTRPATQLVIVFLFLAIILIVAVNSIVHDPIVGYDADAHLDYLAVVSDHLPSEIESGEFFSPPLPYYMPGLVYQACIAYTVTAPRLCKNFGGHFAKGINFLLAIGIILLLVKIANLIKPKNKYFVISTLVFLGGLTVFYKTFAQVRGEPYVAFFTLLVAFLALQMYKDRSKFNWKYASWLGVSLGLLVLSRQWGFFLYPAVFLLLLVGRRESMPFSKRFATTILTFSLAAIIGGWFYFYLYLEFGSFTAFNVDAQAFSFVNQPLSFYRNTGFRDFLLFKSPIRKTFDNQFFPVFYSEMWGDYWGFFTFIREKSTLYSIYANREQITPYLGRVNFVSLFPSVFLLGGFVLGARRFFQASRRKMYAIDIIAFAFFFVAIMVSLLGYAWFLIKYPVIPKGATIKATYMIQIFVLLPFLAAELLELIRARSLKLYYLSLALLGCVFLHNLPAMISRYWWWLR